MLENKVIKNASWIIGCKIIQAVIGLIVTMLTARYLGPSNYGVINYAASVIAFFTPIAQLGLTNVMVKEIVAHPEKEGDILGTSIVMALASATACVVGVCVFALTFNHNEPITILVCVLYSTSMVTQVLELTQYWFQAKLKSKFQSISSLAAYILFSAYQLYLLATGKSIIWFALTYTLQYLLIAVFMFVLYRRNGGPRFRFDKALGKTLFDSSKYYIVSSLMVTIFAQTDKIMLKMMIGDTANGYSSAAVNCAGLTSFVFFAICDSARPAIYEAQLNSRERFEKNMSRLYGVIIYLSLVQSLVMTIFAPIIIRLLYGSDYAPAVSALQIIVWYTTFSYLGMVRNIWILAENKHKYLVLMNFIGATTNVLLNFVLIPPMGIHGAAIASLFTQFFTNVIIGYILKPIRYNNTLMVRGLDVRLLLEVVRGK